MSKQNLVIETHPQNLIAPGSHIQHYRLDAMIATTSSGQIWAITNTEDHQSCVMKLCLSKNSTIVESFIKEASILDRLKDNPGFLSVCDRHINKHQANSDINQFKAGEYSWMVLPLAHHLKEKLSRHCTQLELARHLLNYINLMLDIKAIEYIYVDLKVEHLMHYNNRAVLVDLGSVQAIEPDNQRERRLIAQFCRLAQSLFRAHHLDTIHIYRWLDFAIDSCTNLEALRQSFVDWIKKASSLTQPNILKDIEFHLQNKETEAAIHWIHVLRNTAPEDPNGLHFMGLACTQSEQYALAESYIKAAIHHAGNPVFLGNLAGVLKNQGKTSEAILCYRKALQLDPGSKTTVNNLGALLQEQKSIHDAINIHDAKTHGTDGIDPEVQAKLLSVFTTQPTIRSQNECRLYVEGDTNTGEGTESSDVMSWDQYFGDLSKGSYRAHSDGERRKHTIRTWHYAFKNLALLDKLFALPQHQVKLLDIGCSSGYLRRFLEGNVNRMDDKHFHYYGMDVREDVLMRGVHGTEDIESGAHGTRIPSVFIKHNLEKTLPLAASSIDAVVCFEMIKYMTVPNATHLIQNLHRVLKPEAPLFISTSFISELPGFIDSLSPQEFANLLQSNGFTIQSHYGGQSSHAQIEKVISKEHKALFEAMCSYYPAEIAAAMVTPFYPQVSFQMVFYCMNHP